MTLLDGKGKLAELAVTARAAFSSLVAVRASRNATASVADRTSTSVVACSPGPARPGTAR